MNALRRAAPACGDCSFSAMNDDDGNALSDWQRCGDPWRGECIDPRKEQVRGSTKFNPSQTSNHQLRARGVYGYSRDLQRCPALVQFVPA